MDTLTYQNFRQTFPASTSFDVRSDIRRGGNPRARRLTVRELLGQALANLATSRTNRLPFLKRAAKLAEIPLSTSEHVVKHFSAGKGGDDLCWAFYYFLHVEGYYDDMLSAIDRCLLNEQTIEQLLGRPVAYGAVINRISIEKSAHYLHLAENIRNANSSSYGFKVSLSGRQPDALCDLNFELFFDLVDDLFFTFGFRKVFITSDITDQSDRYSAEINKAYDIGVNIGNAELKTYGTGSGATWCLSREAGPLVGRYLTYERVAGVSLRCQQHEINLSMTVPLGETSICYSDGSRLDSRNREVIIKRLFALRDDTGAGEMTLQKLRYTITRPNHDRSG